MFGKIFFLLTNNIIFNKILISLKLDAMFIARFGIYKRMQLDPTLSPQEMAGFSKKEEVQEAIDKTHDDLKKIVMSELHLNDSILDIGCGAGAYLKEFEEDYACTGIDLNSEMINAGKKYMPKANLILDDFITHTFNKKFNLIYSVSVLEFIPPSKLKFFFEKVASLLENNGMLFLHYPHALNAIDLYFPDLYYIEYSPELIESIATNKFTIQSHQHGWDNRKVSKYDLTPYQPGIRTFKNGYLLIAKLKS